MPDNPDVFKFPCPFPLKVMGLNTEFFETAIREIIDRHLDPDPVVYTSQLSKNGKYLSITATFIATSREQLDELYRELNRHELVKMTL